MVLKIARKKMKMMSGRIAARVHMREYIVFHGQS
jgi:hypothetical protein